jgi:hypothetical protein
MSEKAPRLSGAVLPGGKGDCATCSTGPAVGINGARTNAGCADRDIDDSGNLPFVPPCTRLVTRSLPLPVQDKKNQHNWSNQMLYPLTSPLDPTGPIRPKPASTPDPLRLAAQKLEAGFLAEMLKAAGLGKTSEAFGGGAGEDQFASFLRQAQAEEMVKSGGIGLAESLYHALKERQNV